MEDADDHYSKPLELPLSWMQPMFTDAFEVVSTNGKKIKHGDYLTSGRLPVIDQGEQFIGGYTNNLESEIIVDNPLVVFGDHTRAFKFVKNNFAPGADGIKVLQPSPALIPEFAFYGCLNLQLPNRGYARHFAVLRKSRFPLPPLNEQRRIVEKIETLFARLDAGEAALKKVQTLLARYRQSVLKAAVTGELTQDCRAQNAGRAESGHELLQRILKTRRDHWQGRGKYKEPIAPDTSGLPELPEGWAWATAEQIFGFITKGTTPPKKLINSSESQTIPFLRVTNLTDDGRLNFTDKVFVTDSVHRGFLARSRVFPGDILMNIVGPPLGQVSLVTGEFSEWNVNQAIAIFHSNLGILSKYAVSYFLSETARRWLERRAKATDGQINLTLELCRRLPIPLPSIEEQKAIVRKIEEIIDDISVVDIACQSELARSKALRQSILKQAFAGRLVPQDPNDEPASELLARIRAERQKISDNKRRRSSTLKKQV